MTMVAGEETEVVYNLGNLAWIIVSTALVFIMIPGVGFFYSGLLRKKSALSMLWMSMALLAVVSFQWFFWGFSLAFSTSSTNPFIGVSLAPPLLLGTSSPYRVAVRLTHSSYFNLNCFSSSCRTWTTSD